VRVSPALGSSESKIGTTAINPDAVIAGLDPAIQPLNQQLKHWMPGSKPAPDAIGGPGMTWFPPIAFCPRLPGD
jgi:hypothetical protein